MSLTKYHFHTAVSAFFEMSAEAARRVLPNHLQPMEIRHERGVFAVTAFDFTDSMIGAYQEIVLAVILPPLVKPGMNLPRSAFYPFVVGTSTRKAREHGIERWHLPHFMGDIEVDFDEGDDRIQISVSESGAPILHFAVTAHRWNEADHLYQCFMVDGEDRFKADIHIRGSLTEHEEETGEIKIHDHPMCENVPDFDIEPYPFREIWVRDGVQIFEELETI